MTTAIVYAADPALTVYIDRSNPAAPVRFEYDQGFPGEEVESQSTPYQTADMPWNDQEAAAMVNDYAENIAG